MTPEAPQVRQALGRVRDRIAAAGGDPDRVRVLAVTKGFGPEAVRAALGAGLPAVGENYAQELLDKAASLTDVTPEWHFIGRLQSNKVRHLDGTVACWQSVDRPSLVDELARRSPGARIFVQVNASGEAQKGGAALADVAGLVARAREAGLDVDGLMAVGVLGDDTATGRVFRDVVALADELALPERSIGMTDDLESAVRAGSTMVRIGRALFGARP